jgi:hypothetical protein
VGICALALASAAVGTCIYVLFRIRAVQRDHHVALGGKRKEDLVTHVAGLERSFIALNDQVELATTRIDERMKTVETKLLHALTHRAMIRYDAYGEMSGRQSATIALLDRHLNGFVLSSISHRDGTRMYCTQVLDGKGERELSPEECEAVKLAMSGEKQAVAVPA